MQQPRYKLGTRFSVYTAAGYNVGPNIKNETIRFKPSGAADAKTGTYSIDQLLTGSNNAQTNNSTYRAIGVNSGITFNWLSKKGYDAYKARGDMASAGTNTNPYYKDNGLSGTMPAAAKGENPLY